MGGLQRIDRHSSLQTLFRWGGVHWGPSVHVIPGSFVLFPTYLLTSGEEGQGGPGMEARLASQPSQASLWGQGAVPGMGEGIQLQRQGLHVTTVSSQMASSARVLSFTRCHFLWRQGRGDGDPTKGWLHKPALLRAREILRVGRVGSGFCQTIPTEAKTRTAPRCGPPIFSFPAKLEQRILGTQLASELQDSISFLLHLPIPVTLIIQTSTSFVGPFSHPGSELLRRKKIIELGRARQSLP